MNILITGAGRGLGYEMTPEALERGHAVIAGIRNPDDPGDKMKELAGQYGDKITVARLDVEDEEGIADLAAKLASEGRTLGAIVNNAGILLARDTGIEQLDMKDVAASFEINLFGPIRVVKHFLPLLVEPQASLINISSEAGSLTICISE